MLAPSSASNAGQRRCEHTARQQRTLHVWGGCPTPRPDCWKTSWGQRFSKENLRTCFNPCQDFSIVCRGAVSQEQHTCRSADGQGGRAGCACVSLCVPDALALPKLSRLPGPAGPRLAGGTGGERLPATQGRRLSEILCLGSENADAGKLGPHLISICK